ncbi:MAG: SHOCT domain-containing protein [Chloroflexi bacterium]|nr:SHOCT domain-containing protein [Chloroflexota bacterium]
MGPMGPMMGGGWGNGAAGWIVTAAALLLLALGTVALVLAMRRAGSARGALTPRPLPAGEGAEEILRERYARGELTGQQYREALVDVLKDRYIRGELELDEYEHRLSVLLGTPVGEPRREAEHPDQTVLHR